MAKKAQAVQLQTEVVTDDEWEKLLARDGLILIDVYSEWCGPCTGMTANLKKLKLEIGGDLLQLAIAKSDNIKALERFRNKSEPTWMFVVNGKMVNLTFGANAPRLIQLITSELKKEEEARAGQRERQQWEISELAPEEQVRYEIIESKIRAEIEAEERKKAQELYERRVLECNNILEKFGNVGVILVFPHARTKYQEALSDLLGEAALIISTTEKVMLTEQILEELFYFADERIQEQIPPKEELIGKQSIALLIKRNNESLPSPIDDLIKQVAFGNSRRPPGDENCPYHKLLSDGGEKMGIYTPPNHLARGTAIKLLFPKLCEPYKLPEWKPAPLHVAVAYDAFKYKDVMELASKYPNAIMKYGFFTSDLPGDAKLIAKTVEEFEKRTVPATFEEKIVIQLVKSKGQSFLAFCELGPSFLSSNAVEGEKDCKYFFPSDYEKPQEPTGTKKKPKKKQIAKPVEKEEGDGDATMTVEGDYLQSASLPETGDVEVNLEEEEEGEEIVEVDKATSPIPMEEEENDNNSGVLF